MAPKRHRTPDANYFILRRHDELGMGVDCEPRGGLDVPYVVFSPADVRPLVVHLHPLDPQAPVLQDTGSALGDLAVLAPPDDGRWRVPASLTLELHVLVLLDKDILGRSGEAWFVWKTKKDKWFWL